MRRCSLKKIADMDVRERPREKLHQTGPQSLKDWELFAVILGRGSKGVPVTRLAKDILVRMDAPQGEPDLEQLCRVPGMGLAKASLLLAAMEFARRRIKPSGLKIHCPTDVLPLIRHYGDRKQEHFLCTALNGANEVIATRLVTVGLVNRSQVHPREVFADAITDRAAAVIVAHNHPSGSVEPSPEDIAVTRRLQQSGALLGIELLDHIVFAQSDHFSFALNGLL